ncbi:CYTH domain-containing protein [Patescibacteria group bacterium]|nr:CYTH domain-containing protein [Patescibacteria group bacterium]
MKIEVEVRSFLAKGQFSKLNKHFQKQAKKLGSWSETTVYYQSKQGDLRLRQTDQSSFFIYKQGSIHQSQREEIELAFPKKDFAKMEDILIKMGHPVKMRWFRKRIAYSWKGIKVYLDDTVGNGLMIELEKICSPKAKQKAYQFLKKELSILLAQYKIKPTTKSELDKRFIYYKKHWQKLTRKV